jgi:hypothetical protein
MAIDVAKRWARLLAFLGAVLFGTVAHAGGYSIRQLGAQQLRLATISYRLDALNSGACSKPQMLSGLVLHDLTEYPLQVRAAVATAFSMHGGFGVLGIVPDSAASRAGFEVDDEIVALNDRPLEDPQAVGASGQSYRRLETFSNLFERTLGLGTADLLVRRHGRLLRMTLSAQRGCGGQALLINSSDLNAWSDGSHVFVSSAMLALASSDDELAFVVAHEMAHNILGHSSGGDTHGLLGLFGLGAAKVRREEMTADSFAIPLMNSGGYSPQAATGILERMRRILWWDISLDHPTFGARIRTVEAVIAKLAPTQNAVESHSLTPPSHALNG